MGDTPSKTKISEREKKTDSAGCDPSRFHGCLGCRLEDSCSCSFLQQQAAELKSNASSLSTRIHYRAEVLGDNGSPQRSELLQDNKVSLDASRVCQQMFSSSFECSENCACECCQETTNIFLKANASKFWVGDDPGYQRRNNEDKETSQSVAFESHSFLSSQNRGIADEDGNIDELPFPDAIAMVEELRDSHEGSKSNRDVDNRRVAETIVGKVVSRPINAKDSGADAAEQMGALPGAEGSGSESSNGVASDEYFTPDSPETESSESDVLETEHSGVEAKSRTLNYSSHLNFLPAEFRLEVMEKLCNLTPVTEVLNVIEDAYFCAKELCPKPIRCLWTIMEKTCQLYAKGMATTSWPWLWLIHRVDRCASKALDSFLVHVCEPM